MVALVLFEIDDVLLAHPAWEPGHAARMREVVTVLAETHKVGAITSVAGSERALLSSWQPSGPDWEVMAQVVGAAHTPGPAAVLAALDSLALTPGEVVYVASPRAQAAPLRQAGLHVVVYDPAASGGPGQPPASCLHAGSPDQVLARVQALDGWAGSCPA